MKQKRKGYIIVKNMRILVEIIREVPGFGRVDYIVVPVAGTGEQQIRKESFYELN